MSTYRQKRGNSRRTAAGKRRKKRGGKSTAFSGNVYIKCGILILTILTLILTVRGFLSRGGGHVNVDASEPDIDVQLLDVNTIFQTWNREQRHYRNRDPLYG